MKRLAWLLTLPLAVAVVVFAVRNRETVPVDPWPLNPPFELPLYLVALGAVVLGFIAGALVQWMAAGKRRQQARRSNRRLNELERAVGAAAVAKPATEAGSDTSGSAAALPETRLLTGAER